MAATYRRRLSTSGTVARASRRRCRSRNRPPLNGSTNPVRKFPMILPILFCLSSGRSFYDRRKEGLKELGRPAEPRDGRPPFIARPYVCYNGGASADTPLIRRPGMDLPQVVRNLDGSTTECTDIPLLPGHLERLLRELFEQHWREIIFGPCIQGAVFEVRLTEPPEKISMLDGYLTVDVGPWHFHLCIDEHKNVPVAELARQRQVSRAAFFRDS